MITSTRVGIAIFSAAAVLGPLYTVAEYSAVTNSISELGAQQTENNFIMITGFVILGGSIVFDGIRRFQAPLLPFILFGAAMAIAGIFPHKPLDVSLNFNVTVHTIHGVMASIAGTVITVGFIWQGLRNSGRQRYVCFYMAAAAVLLPMLMLSIQGFQGIIQRLMYLQILGWLWIKFPDSLGTEERTPRSGVSS